MITGRARTWLLTVLVTVLAGLGIQVMTAGAASAFVGNWRLGTYNMQGSGGGLNGQSKWQSDVYPLMQQGIQVLALQEAGTIPASATNVRNRTLTVHTNDGGYQYFGLTTAEWRPGGSRGATYYIYLLNTDPQGHRVNVAFITNQRADSIATAYGGAGGAGRPALGLRFGNDMFWSVHALSNGGSNAAQLVREINAASAGRNWAAMGDWNRTPESMETQLWNQQQAIAGDVTFYHTRGQETQTHQGGNQLDYMVSNGNDDSVGAGRMQLMSSDHYPVMFYRLHAQADIALTNSADDRFLGLTEKSGRNGVGIDVNETHQDAFGGAWYFDRVGADSVGHDRYRLRNRSTHECLYLPHSNSVAVQEPCDGSLGQMFYARSTPQQANDPMIKIQSSVGNDLCVGEISPNGIDGVPVVLTDCDNTGTYWYWRYAGAAIGTTPIVRYL
ncbi:endonuclease/exonuclease/phosphatase family protein [Streptomyces sp. NPDC050704]|uniref:endonuclease/exonuclease/phosphatase family protein n=1 Tax=Streptomyces sp. NPDC050704 TaxID=3157219 RepID=UPI00341EA9EA